LSDAATDKDASKKKWLPFLIRGIMGIVIAATMVRDLFATAKTATNLPMYLGVYFIANGVLSLKLARAETTDKSKLLAPLASIIGGLALVVTYPFSSYRETLVATDLGRVAFGAIVIIIGLLQVQGTLHITPQPVLKNVGRVLGLLEILLGVAVIASPIAWQALSIGFVWLILVAVYMFYVAFRLRRQEKSL